MLQLKNFWILPGSLLLAMILTIIPLPDWIRYIRPDWVTMVAIFWSITLPRVYGIGSAWITGLLMDVLLNSLLGQNAMTLSLLVYISSRMHQQFVTAPLMQQAIFVCLLLLIKQFLSFWIAGMTGHLPANMALYFAPSLIALLLWPWLFIVLRDTCATSPIALRAETMQRRFSRYRYLR